MSPQEHSTPTPLGQRQRRQGCNEWVFSECRPVVAGAFVDIELLYGAEALQHVPPPPESCPTSASASGENTICARCGEVWAKGGQRACVSAHKILTLANHDALQAAAPKPTSQDLRGRESQIQDEIREAIKAYLPSLQEATCGLIEVGATIDLQDEWARLMPWLRDVGELDLKTNQIKEARLFVNGTKRFKVAKVKPFGNFFSPEFVFGWAASVYPDGVDPATGQGEVVLMGTFFKLHPVLSKENRVQYLDLKPLHDFLVYWDNVKVLAEAKRA